AFVGVLRVAPGIADITREIVAKIRETLALYFQLQVGSFGASVVGEAVEDGNVDIDPDGAVPVRDVIIADGSLADDAESADGGPPEVMLCAAEFLCSIDLALQRQDFRPLAECILN